jgi:hypothetical protein
LIARFRDQTPGSNCSAPAFKFHMLPLFLRNRSEKRQISFKYLLSEIIARDESVQRHFAAIYLRGFSTSRAARPTSLLSSHEGSSISKLLLNLGGETHAKMPESRSADHVKISVAGSMREMKLSLHSGDTKTIDLRGPQVVHTCSLNQRRSNVLDGTFLIDLPPWT